MNQCDTDHSAMTSMSTGTSARMLMLPGTRIGFSYNFMTVGSETEKPKCLTENNSTLGRTLRTSLENKTRQPHQHEPPDQHEPTEPAMTIDPPRPTGTSYETNATVAHMDHTDHTTRTTYHLGPPTTMITYHHEFTRRDHGHATYADQQNGTPRTTNEHTTIDA
ncbi:hypothetical protein OS493_038461 [Desmophyllum pertusum]|uniref:Uncharacterized protein n=1 Tax=Desmophyllum pertusum TaxID=174260 RepID=A0A9X0CCG6_9CNID|nr:hypothetical protein OS493_038461 [Desmophyllum pertusum]